MGSKKAPTVTQSTTTQLSPEAQQIASLAFPFAQQYAKTQIQLPGSTVAGFNPNELAAQQDALTQGGAGQQLGGRAAESLGFLLNPDILSPDSNPYLRAAGQGVADTTTENLLRRILPSLRSGASVSGGPFSGGSSKEGIATGLAAGDTSNAIARALAQMYSQSYQSGLGTMLQAGQLTPSIQAAQLFGPQVQSAVGGQQRALEQAQLDEANTRAILEQVMPLLQAQQLYGLISGMPGATNVSTATGAVPPSGGVGGALGGAATGASLGSMFGPIGTGLGALLGGAGGFFL